MHLTELMDTSPVVAVDIGKVVRHGKSRILYISAVKVCGWIAYEGHKFDGINDVGSFYRRICFRRMSCIGANSKKDLINVESGECDLHAALLGFKNFSGDVVFVGYDMKQFDDLLVESGKKYGIEFGNRRLDAFDVARSIFGDKIKNYDLYYLHRRCGNKCLQPENLCYSAIAVAELLAGLAVRDEWSHNFY